MAYDEELAERIRAVLSAEDGITERRMFGGLAFLVDRHLAVAASGQGGMMLRCDPDDWVDLLDGDRVRPMVMRGRELAGWLRLAGDLIAEEAALAEYVRIGVAFARSLPPK